MTHEPALAALRDLAAHPFHEQTLADRLEQAAFAVYVAENATPRALMDAAAELLAVVIMGAAGREGAHPSSLHLEAVDRVNRSVHDRLRARGMA